MTDKAFETSSLLDNIPKIQGQNYSPLLQYKGFWFFPSVIKSLPFIETQYNPLPTDVLIASFPKTGTAWLKAITFEILHVHTPNNLLQTHSPHELVPFLESFGENLAKKIDEIPSPRIFGTHVPYSILPKKVKESSSRCKIIYVSRNPADTIVSGWKFYNKAFGSQKTLEEYFKEFINDVTLGGPLFDHVLEYWEERERENMLFVTYEGLKKNPNENVKRIAEFLGSSLSEAEIEQVVRKTSFEHLSKLDINMNEEKGLFVTEKLTLPYSIYFRNGNVGDGKKCLTPEMMQKLKVITYQKWEGSGLESKLCDTTSAKILDFPKSHQTVSLVTHTSGKEMQSEPYTSFRTEEI